MSDYSYHKLYWATKMDIILTLHAKVMLTVQFYKLKLHLHALFHLQPSVCRMWDEDRVMATDIEIATKLLRSGKVNRQY